MKQKIIYEMTHDSIGLGEDGPTHQPIEQLTSLRSVPNLNVLRPADAIETLECWAFFQLSHSSHSGTGSPFSRKNCGLKSLDW